jgi:fatty-acyl-CoA synthase
MRADAVRTDAGRLPADAATTSAARMLANRPARQVVTQAEPTTWSNARATPRSSARIDRLARALRKLGVEPGDRVATFAWNNQRHFECYFAIPCIGAVLHTLNLRLFAEQIAYIINHAEDRSSSSTTRSSRARQARAQLPSVEHFVVMGDGDRRASCRARCATRSCSPRSRPTGHSTTPSSTSARRRRSVTRAARPATPRASSTRTARSACTRRPADDRRDRALPAPTACSLVVPMFHVNAWGCPTPPRSPDADLMLPGRFLQAEPLAGLIERARDADGLRADDLRRPAALRRRAPPWTCRSLRTPICGGSAVPRRSMKDFEERHGVRLFQAWGMTETSPMATFSRPPRASTTTPTGTLRAKQGVRCRSSSCASSTTTAGGALGRALDRRDRGPRPVGRRAYYREPAASEKFDDGWLRTGDIANVDEKATSDHRPLEGRDQVRRRVDLLGRARERADGPPRRARGGGDRQARRALGRAPARCVVLREGAAASAPSSGRAPAPARRPWWLPDEFAFIDEVPKTSVGKFDKKVLRAQLAEGTLEGRVRVT